MIVRVLVDSVEYGVDVYENNFDGEVQINDTYHCDDKHNCEVTIDDRDTIFGTVDQQITIKIKKVE